MKLIHTGDWHIGKIVNEFSMIEDQKIVLKQLINIIEEEKPNALIIAGDLYDRSIPPVEAVELLDEVFSKILLELKVPILAIAGNHDSPERVGFGSRIFTENGLHIAGSFDKEKKKIKKVVLKSDNEKFNFYLLPYCDPKEIKHVFRDDKISNNDDAMRVLIDNIKMDLNKDEKNILITHAYANFIKNNEELELSESERPLSIGGTDLVNAEYFSGFTYTALGHLHKPQKVRDNKIRYSGSLLKYSFSEVNHKKGATIVNIDKNGEIDIDFREFNPKRDMRIIKGPLEQLISPEVYKDTNTEDYIYAILTDKGELVDPIAKLRAVYPNVMGLSREEEVKREDSKTSAGQGYKNKTKLELFKEFYNSMTGKELEKESLKIITNVIEKIEKEVS
ncbi:exonuclease SbcCD subunit D [Clostridium cochlearium]|jgi:exonuclease SbcD|uniref:exonuclease SbcCD subunit D n=1 Tax=Clostridium cochlearium TaxID=1494 RepID=UPI000BBCD307|nr:exonuclease SbcCD subunit D [Clostridium cochlearium]MBE6066025.1 exonuclease SbcCD subunit D [Clostridium cochlearium]MBU5270473.1 exonuclease SbcCD subunit D [Clostridium cochlearium]MDU1443276.1 exonuclease SbcCD subunit D [Clostridium cochlearium]NMA58540.1 exonuclease SbcCD subunit D [Clostridium cochlearium]